MKKYINCTKILSKMGVKGLHKFHRFVIEYSKFTEECPNQPLTLPFEKTLFEIHIEPKYQVVTTIIPVRYNDSDCLCFDFFILVDEQCILLDLNCIVDINNWFEDNRIRGDIIFDGASGELEEVVEDLVRNCMVSTIHAILKLASGKYTKIKQYRDPTPVKNGKAKPFNEYWILRVNTNYKPPQTPYLGGTHASPREHERRAHRRTNSKGVSYEVRATIVNKGVGGKIKKDYQLT